MYESTEIVGLAYHVSVGFHISPKVSVHGGYLSMIDGQGATVLSGLDASSRLFLFSNGSTIDVEGDGKRIVQSSLFTHYLLIGYKLRELAAEETKPQYSGFNLGYGCNWYLGRSFKWNYAKDFFVNPEFDSGNLKSPTGNSSRNSNFSLGFGTLF
ncbi:MAG: hypothetical protein NT027_03450 [Proteobacteria bacterium]|nr:hypothetical protein [Pseudomonadota bacterium]